MKKTLGIRTLAALLITVVFVSMLPQFGAKAAPAAQKEEEGATEEDNGTEEDAARGEGEPGEEAVPDGEAPNLSTEDLGKAENAGEPNRKEPQTVKTSHTQDVFFSPTVLKGILSSSDLYFYVPEYWDTKYVYVALEYRASQLIRETASALTFSVNQTPISSCKITYEGGDSQIAYVVIPMEMVQEGYNSFTVSAYAKLYDEGGCMDDFSSASWLSISEDSYIRCGYEIKDPDQNISYYPYPFLSTTKATGEGLTIAVSDKASNGEVAAAMNLMADLSGGIQGENEIQFALLSDVSKAETDRTILVSQFRNLPEAYQNKVLSKEGIENRGIITFTEDDTGNPLLIITSEDEKCLLEAAYMLMDEERVSQENSNVATVPLRSGDAQAGQGASLTSASGDYTVEELAGGGLNFTGPFLQEQVVYLPFSEDYMLMDGGKINLYFRYSENLDFDRSLVTVYWGNVPVASKKLEKENAPGDELVFNMPEDVVGTSAGAVRIAFHLELEDMVCTPRQDQMPWAYVSGDSWFHLPASGEFNLSFDTMPAPFRRNNQFNNVLMVISDKPTTEELSVYAQIMGSFGSGAAPYGTFSVKRAGEFSAEDGKCNMIVAGTYIYNTMLRALNDYLYFPYSDSGRKFVGNEQLILSEDYADQMAILQLLESPYETNCGILAVTGVSKESMKNAEEFLRQEKLRAGLTKDCVIIGEGMEIRSFRFITKDTDTGEPTLAETFGENRQSVLFTVIATSAMLMMLIAVIIILIRIKTYHKKEDE